MPESANKRLIGKKITSGCHSAIFKRLPGLVKSKKIPDFIGPRGKGATKPPKKAAATQSNPIFKNRFSFFFQPKKAKNRYPAKVKIPIIKPLCKLAQRAKNKNQNRTWLNFLKNPFSKRTNKTANITKESECGRTERLTVTIIAPKRIASTFHKLSL